MKTFFFMLLFLSTSVHAEAGDKGNIVSPWDGFYGGDAVVCRDPSFRIQSAHLLDYTEQDMLRRKTVIVHEPMPDLIFVDQMAAKLERIAPDTFISFRREASKLAGPFSTFGTRNYRANNHVHFVRGRSLIDVADSRQLRNAAGVKRKGCKVEQLVIRQKRFHSVQYIVQADIFEKLSPRDKRGLILHEAIYHSFNMYYDDEDSARTRFFTRSIMQWKLAQLSDEALMVYLKNAFVKF